jgi:hypothetical protein
VRGFASHLLGRTDVARADFEASERLALDGVNVQIPGFFDAAVTSAAEGALVAHEEGDEARADALLATAAARAVRSEAALLITRQHRLWLAAMRGDPVAAREHAEACRVLTARLDYAAYTHGVDLVGAWADAVLGDGSGVARADAAFDRYLLSGLCVWEPMYLLLRAEAHGAWGGDEQARDLVTQSRAVEARTGEVCSSPRLLAWAEVLVPSTG